MQQLIVIDKKTGKKKLVNIPSWDKSIVNNQIGQPAYDISLTSNGSGSLSMP